MDQEFAATEPPGTSDGGRGATILIVEDSPVQAELLRRALEGAGYKVIVAGDGAEGLALAKANHPIAVVSDINMPVMDGYAMCRAIRSEESLNATPVILLTMLSEPEDVIHGLNAGADAYLTKPYNIPSLVARIKTLLAHPPAPPPAPESRKVEVWLASEAYLVETPGPRTLNLLISTYENAVLQNRELTAIQQALDDLNEHLEQKVLEKAAALRESEVKFHTLAEQSLVGIAIGGPEGYQYANPRFAEIFGYTQEEILTLAPRVLVAEKDQALVAESIRGLVGGEATSTQYTFQGRRKDGSAVGIEIRGSSMEIGAKPVAIVVILDVTQRREQELKIARLSRIHAVLSGINSAIVRIRDRQQLFEEACRIAAGAGRFPLAWLGLVDRDAMQIRPVAWAGREAGLLSGIQSQLSLEDGTSRGPGPSARAVLEKKAVIVNNAQGDPCIVRGSELLEHGIRSVAVFPLLVSNEAAGVLALCAADVGFFDEEELKLLRELAGDIAFALDHIAKEEKLDYLAYYDALTGLPNRALFDDRLEQRIRAAHSDREAFPLVMLDIAGFRHVNETFGRQAGDELLRQVAERLKGALQETDTLAHIEGDYFNIATGDVEKNEGVARLLEQILTSISGQPFRMGGDELRIAARAGVAVYPADGADARSLVGNAEAALRKAKSTGERYKFYALEMNARVAEQFKLESELHRAVAENQFVLYYQPRVDVADGHLSGLEALVRWVHPERGLVAPAEFIPLLERTGLILEVGRWALHRAAFDHVAWRAAGLEPPRIAVNVSALQLRRTDAVEDMSAAISEASDSGGHLDIEITESMLMEDIDGTIGKLAAVRAMGAQIAIDDFGTGYSSLSYLARLPINILKIDRSFVSQMTKGPEQMAMVTTVISLARALNLKVVAEGVETEEQANLLRLLHCDELQGYLFGRPMPAEMLSKWIADRPH